MPRQPDRDDEALGCRNEQERQRQRHGKEVRRRNSQPGPLKRGRVLLSCKVNGFGSLTVTAALVKTIPTLTSARHGFDSITSVDIIRTSSVVYFPCRRPSTLNAADRLGTSVLDLIGRTPLVRLQRFERETPGVELWAKAEWQNPGGSVKDRAAARMILDGEASGALTPDRVILDATSGNTGIAYAMVGAARGYRSSCACPTTRAPSAR